MKKFWKVLGIAALAAALPVRFKKDEATGKKTYQSLLMSVDVGPGEGDEGTAIGINIGEGVLTNAISGLVNAKKEAELFTDDPSEAVLFADDDPAAAVVMAEPDVPDPAVEEEAPQAEEDTDPVATEEDTDPAATEEDFDPDL